MKPLILLGGLINIHEYAYRFILSQAKIEIMSMDIPYTDYGSHEETEVGNRQGQPDRADRLNEESVKKMKERIEREKNIQGELNFAEFLNWE